MKAKVGLSRQILKPPLFLFQPNIQPYSTSNGNDIETKRNETSIIRVYPVSKRNEPIYSRTWKDRSEANTIITVVCQIAEKTNIISLRLCSIKAKRAHFKKIYAGSNVNVLGQSKTLQNRSKANVSSSFTNQIEEKTKFSLQQDRSESKPCESPILARSKRKRIRPKHGRIEEKTMWFSPTPNIRLKQSEPSQSKSLQDRSKTNRIALVQDRQEMTLFAEDRSKG